MYVCICRAVTEDQVLKSIAGGATTVGAVSRDTGACTKCKRCWVLIDSMLSKEDDVSEPEESRSD
jgi:bacterioferritin-associated ferredoxin